MSMYDISTVPRKYAEAHIARLYEGQDPDGQVTDWLWSESLNLVLVADHGRGRTYTACAVLHQFRIENPTRVIGYAPCRQLVTPDGGLLPGGTLDQATRADLLAIDDLGDVILDRGQHSIIAPKRPHDPLYSVLDYRTCEELPSVITTTLPVSRDSVYGRAHPEWPTLQDMYGKLADRVLSGASVVYLTGLDLREPAYGAK